MLNKVSSYIRDMRHFINFQNPHIEALNEDKGGMELLGLWAAVLVTEAVTTTAVMTPLSLPLKWVFVGHTFILTFLQAQPMPLFWLRGMGVAAALLVSDLLRAWPATLSCPSKAGGTQSHTKG